jgi:hypothetical protein
LKTPDKMTAQTRFRVPRKSLSLDDARNLISATCDSYSRLPALIALVGRDRLSLTDCRILLGEFWSICDNIGAHQQTVSMLLPMRGPCLEMMDTTERAALGALPDVVTVYRGCDADRNPDGLSWSLDRKTAARFPFQLRYRAASPVLVTGTVARADILALKFDRNEREVISRQAARRALSR